MASANSSNQTMIADFFDLSKVVAVIDKTDTIRQEINNICECNNNN